MGKKSQGGSQQVVQKNDPWEGVQPHLLGMYSAAGDWFNNGPRGFYTGQTLAGVPQQMESAMQMMEARARAGSPTLRGAHGTVSNIQSGAYTGGNPLMTGAALGQNRYAMGDNQRDNWYANDNGIKQNIIAGGQLLRDNPFAQNSRINSNRTAMGEFLGSNPYLRSMVEGATRSVKDDFMESIAPSLASQFSAAGRTGSGAHMGAFAGASSKLAERLGDISAGLFGQSYENERGRMAAAEEAERQRQAMAYEAERGAQRQSLSDEYGRKFAAYTGERGLSANAYEAERGAYRDMWSKDPSLRLQAAGMVPALAAADYMDADRLMGVGLQRRQIEQESLDDQRMRYDYNRDEPLQRLLSYNSILQGATPYASSQQSGSNKQPYNRLTGAIGGGLGGYALGNLMGFGPVGAVLGGLGGLFG